MSRATIGEYLQGIFVFIRWTVGVMDTNETRAGTVWIWKCLTLLEFYARRKLNAWQSSVAYTKTFPEKFFTVRLTVEGDSRNFISLRSRSTNSQGLRKREKKFLQRLRKAKVCSHWESVLIASMISSLWKLRNLLWMNVSISLMLQTQTFFPLFSQLQRRLGRSDSKRCF